MSTVQCPVCSVQWPRQRWVFEDTAHIFNRSQSDGVRRLMANAIKNSIFLFNPSPISWVNIMAFDSIFCPNTRCPALLCFLRRGFVACKNAYLGCRMQITSCVPVLCNVFLRARMHVLVTEYLMCYRTQCPVFLCYYM